MKIKFTILIFTLLTLNLFGAFANSEVISGDGDKNALIENIAGNFNNLNLPQNASIAGGSIWNSCFFDSAISL